MSDFLDSTPVEQLDLTISGLRRHYENGDFTPRALIRFLRERAAQFVDRNIWIHQLDDAEIEPYLAALDAPTAATLPLYGVPFAIKDNIDLGGIPTTAACPAFAYTPSEHATAVALFIKAGAIPLGKTNLDQLATGLVGVRSPWGECKNSFDPAYVSGGSSAGSAVAVALGLASFSLGTDTAGSGRIPAAFNNIVGLKPTKGALSTRGVVPACRSLDCVSLFALTAVDLNALFAIAAKFDADDDYARPNPAHNTGSSFGTLSAHPFKFGVPRADQLQFFGNDIYATAFANAVENLKALGGVASEIDFSPFMDAAILLYEGPWVTERYLVAQTLLREKPDALLPVIRDVIAPGANKSAADAFSSIYRMQHFRRVAETILDDLAFIVTPTAGTHWTRQDLADNPIARNSDLGYYTNFMNLLDLSAVAVPTEFLPNGLPFGVTLFADRFTDLRLLSYADALQRYLNLPLGAPAGGRDESLITKYSSAVLTPSTRNELSTIDVIVCGAHMSGLPLNGQLTGRRATLARTARTKKAYRFFALPGPAPKRPGLIRDAESGYSIDVEVWRVPAEEFGSLVALIPAPLGIGKVELEDGVSHCGFLCEAYALVDAHEISTLGSWREYLKTQD